MMTDFWCHGCHGVILIESDQHTPHGIQRCGAEIPVTPVTPLLEYNLVVFEKPESNW
jgi:hypothetical protein